MSGDRLTLETADVEWHPSSEPGSLLIAYVGLYRVHLGHDGECWAWRLDLLGECDSPDTQVDGANGLIPGSLGKAQTRAVDVALLLSELVEGVDVRAYRERLPKVSTPLGDLEPHIAAGIGDEMGELDADREERESECEHPGMMPGEFCVGCHAVVPREGPDIPRDYTVPREQLERLLGFILAGEQVAYCTDPVSTVGEVDAAIAKYHRGWRLASTHSASLDAVRRALDGVPGVSEVMVDADLPGVIERLRGPTEGASDVLAGGSALVVDGYKLAAALGWHGPAFGMVEAVRGLVRSSNLRDAIDRERPPTGEASPAIEEVKAQRDRAESEADEFEFTLAAVIAQRNDARSKLGALIGAVEAVLETVGSTNVVDTGRSLRAAIAAAKGDAPTASAEAPCSCMAKVMVHDDGSRSCTECLAEWPRPVQPNGVRAGPTPEPDIGNNGEWPPWCGIGRDADRRHEAELGPEGVERCRHCHAERGVSRDGPAPAPQVPDSPGWWKFKHGERYLGVSVHDKGHKGQLRFETPGGTMAPVSAYPDGWWGGRCTRGAPNEDAVAFRERELGIQTKALVKLRGEHHGLRGRIEAVARELGERELSNGGLGDPGLDGRARAYREAVQLLRGVLDA